MSRRPARKRERKLCRRRKRGFSSSELGSFSPGGRGSKIWSESGSRGNSEISVPFAVEAEERWVRRSFKSSAQPGFG